MKPLPILACALAAALLVPSPGAARPLPIRGLVREPVEPFPGGGPVAAYRLAAGAAGTEPRPDDLAFDAATEIGPAAAAALVEIGRGTRTNLEYRWLGSVHGGRDISSCAWRA